jgi:hypothetical protein
MEWRLPLVKPAIVFENENIYSDEVRNVISSMLEKV